jgi:hypothetical protein
MFENLNFFNVLLITFFVLIGMFLFHRLIVALVDSVFPYTDPKYRFFVEENSRYKESPLYIAKTYFDSKGNEVLKYKRVTCVEGQSFLKAESDFFLNFEEHSRTPLLNFLEINIDEAYLLFKKHKKETANVRKTKG